MLIGNTQYNGNGYINVSSGTAVEGVDFDITTNGNFASPVKYSFRPV